MSTSATGAPSPATPEHRQKTSAVWIVPDVVAVVVFAIIGTASHDGVTAGDVWRVGFPFLTALLIAWLVPAVRRAPWALWPVGVIVWLMTALIGLALRWMLGGGISGAMPLITIASLGVLMLGWRAVATLLRRRTARV